METRFFEIGLKRKQKKSVKMRFNEDIKEVSVTRDPSWNKVAVIMTLHFLLGIQQSDCCRTAVRHIKLKEDYRRREPHEKM